jgi:hypothetical protein
MWPILCTDKFQAMPSANDPIAYDTQITWKFIIMYHINKRLSLSRVTGLIGVSKILPLCYYSNNLCSNNNIAKAVPL